ncbi:3-hydroxyacyl-ACP dehydratase FabZ family protein [Micromonospora sp. DT201]|uniref:3-hydroxyacyl-ACP dehydratase FabZ family protein n=1 Tax=Micromonospora sp. DT201 TaxID=3393442 RepID=UPI003CEE22F7
MTPPPKSLTPAQVRRLLPHRYPMLLVDRVPEVAAGDRLSAVKAVTWNEPCYAGLGEDAGTEQLAYPQSLLIESWGQSAGLLAVLSAEQEQGPDSPVMLAGAMAGIEFRAAVYPGAVLRHEVRLERALSDTVVFAGETYVDDRLVVSYTRMVMAFRPADQLRPTAA